MKRVKMTRDGVMQKPFWTAAIVCALALIGQSCQKDAMQSPESKTLIREGDLVTTKDQGPDRFSTVGLRIETPEALSTCTAAIISSQVLVTAAHCIPEEGVIDAYFTTELADAAVYGDLIPATEARVHGGFDNWSRSGELPPHDVALLKLKRPIPESHAPVPVIPSYLELKSGEEVLIAGYGITEYGGDSTVLRSVLTTFAGNDYNGRIVIQDEQGRGACSGDSGGPLYVQREDQWFLAGVLSGGPVPCRGVNIYTSLDSERQFIAEALASFAEEK